jgi:hypothetical protein
VKSGGLRESAHNLVAGTAPPNAQLGDEGFIRKVINQYNPTLRSKLKIIQKGRTERPDARDRLHPSSS